VETRDASESAFLFSRFVESGLRQTFLDRVAGRGKGDRAAVCMAMGRGLAQQGRIDRYWPC